MSIRPDGFQLIAAAIGDELLFSDGLRIIAKDAKGMSDADRKILIDAAECLEQVGPGFYRLSVALTEANAQLKAAHDRIAAMEKKPAAPMTMGLSAVTQMRIHPGFGARK